MKSNCETFLLTFSACLVFAACTGDEPNGETSCSVDADCSNEQICSSAGDCIDQAEDAGTEDIEDRDTEDGVTSDADADAASDDAADSTHLDGDTSEDGSADAVSCQQLDARGRIGSQDWTDALVATVGTAVELDAGNSTDDVSDFSWTLDQKPSGSATSIDEGADPSTATFEVDVAGQYVAALQALSADGQPCENTAQVSIVAVPPSDLRIELRWSHDVESDPDGSSFRSPDVDLHYKRAGDEWNGGDDIFWSNRSADWGVSGDESDDPLLIEDAVSAPGPEVVIHSNLPRQEYQVGVHNYPADLNPSADVDVDIYLDGVLTHSTSGVILQSRDFLYVGNVVKTEQSTTFEPVEQTSNGFP
jgi:hypothetical protein